MSLKKLLKPIKWMLKPLLVLRTASVAAPKFELSFWVNKWPYRHLSRQEIIETVRRDDAKWFLEEMGFRETTAGAFDGFHGVVLEVGSGPIGFFEGVQGVTVDAIDPLMKAYSTSLPFAVYGAVNNYQYSDTPVESIEKKYDFVVNSNVLDHTDDWKAHLAYCINAVNRPTGQLLLFTHCHFLPFPGHSQLFMPNDVVAELLRHKVAAIEPMKITRDDSGHADFICALRCRFQ